MNFARLDNGDHIDLPVVEGEEIVRAFIGVFKKHSTMRVRSVAVLCIRHTRLLRRTIDAVRGRDRLASVVIIGYDPFGKLKVSSYQERVEELARFGVETEVCCLLLLIKAQTIGEAFVV